MCVCINNYINIYIYYYVILIILLIIKYTNRLVNCNILEYSYTDCEISFNTFYTRIIILLLK